MKLKFDPTLQYQQDAINAVVGVFDGQPFVQSGVLKYQVQSIVYLQTGIFLLQQLISGKIVA